MSKEKQKTGLSRALKTFFGVGDFGFTMMTNVDTFYASFFFTNIAQLSLGVIAAITTIASTVDAVLSWVYGIFLNKVKPRKWGRYRSWLILTPWLVPFLYAFEFIRFSNVTLTVVVMTIAMIVSRIAWNIPFVANVTMINVAGKTPEDRIALSSVRNIWNTLAQILFSYVGPAVVAFFAGLLGEQNAYAAAAFAFGAVMAAGYFAHFKMFDGYEESGAEEQARMEAARQKTETGQSAEKQPGVWASIRVNPHLIGLIAASFTKYLVLFMVNGFAIYYFTYVAHDEGMFSVFLLISNLLGIAASYAAQLLAKRISARMTTIAAYVLMIVALLAGFLQFSNVTFAVVMMCVTVFAYTVTNACEPALFADCAIYSEYRTGYDASGTIMGLINVPVKVSIICKGLLISACLAAAGFSAEISAADATVELQRGICVGFMLVPAVVSVIGLLLLIFVYRLTDEKIREYSAAIAGRK